MRSGPERRARSDEARPEGVPSVLAGNTPDAHGELAAQPSRRHPEAIPLPVSVRAATTGPYPIVQRLTATGPSPPGRARPVGGDGRPGHHPATGPDRLAAAPVRDARPARAAPGDRPAPLPPRSMRSRVGAGRLDDHHERGPVMAAVDPAALLGAATHAHRAARSRPDGGWSEPPTAAEAAVRQIEAADTLPMATSGDFSTQEGAAGLVRHPDTRARMAAAGDTSGSPTGRMPSPTGGRPAPTSTSASPTDGRNSPTPTPGKQLRRGAGPSPAGSGTTPTASGAARPGPPGRVSLRSAS